LPKGFWLIFLYLSSTESTNSLHRVTTSPAEVLGM